MDAGSAVPPINDVTTDTHDPPQFVVVLALRNGARNPPDDGGEPVAILQRAAWPEIVPMETPVVIRLRDLPGAGTRIDVRSKSRIGRNDLGANARRIRTFLADLQRTLGTQR